ncbi:MAG: HAD hydrolase family protein [Candidatus Latescibacteria bacterium]|jgi:hydroxymethylpyrimidine pyrophosphatase-like HAD family hydrolase|nr:HAD hydrolase family protein [Candidatus Latescibacterota bacterium]MBT5831359.1 HAD hydrolase family protein [Candidatus Latescibacterota bacterium]
MTSANQIIALDLDGTILRTNKTVSDRTRTVIDRKDGGAQILEELI